MKRHLKLYVKLVEPRKQVLYPYNRRRVISSVSQPLDPELTKPGWWPVGALHREPDHLLKPNRLRLLVYILCELKDTHGIIVDKLRSASQDVAPANRLEILDEIYFTHLPKAIYQDHELRSRVHAAPISGLDPNHDGHRHYSGDDPRQPLGAGILLMIHGHQTSLTTEFNTFPAEMVISAMPRETPSSSNATHIDPDHLLGYFV
ncbi:hypothetical protein N7522_005297 [Penicillium canescens]|nr:hypothetical protein N7522_005297 [Penicillium canescens]